MFRDRLLERIRKRERNPGEREDWEAGSEVDSIMRHLARMLNSRQGGVPISPAYGIPDYTNVPGETLTEIAQEMAKAIKQVIIEFEPRLANVQVTFDASQNDVLKLRFRVEGTLSRDRSVPVRLETVLTTEGRVSVGA